VTGRGDDAGRSAAEAEQRARADGRLRSTWSPTKHRRRQRVYVCAVNAVLATRRQTTHERRRAWFRLVTDAATPHTSRTHQSNLYSNLHYVQRKTHPLLIFLHNS